MDDYLDRIHNANTLQGLFEIWKQKKPSETIDHEKNFFIEDGIVDSNVWNGGEKKILFILKEAYGDDWAENTLTTWLATCHPKARIWSRIARMVYGIQNTTMTEMRRYKAQLSDAEHNAALHQIAVLNLKKSNGKSTSSYDEIAQYAEYDREEIKKEFELIDADIVICGSTFRTFMKQVYEIELYPEEQCDNWYYHIDIGRKRLFIDFYHPANRWPDLFNYYSLVSLYQQALLKENHIERVNLYSKV